MATPMAHPKRLPALDGVRGLAIVAVVAHHSFHLKLLWMGVDLFFILSGFLITSILLREKHRHDLFRRYIGYFYERRVRRILPPYVLTLALAAAVYGTWWLHWWPYYIAGMNLMSSTWTPQIDSLPLWSLAVEEQFYLVWPVVVFFLPRRKLVITAVSLIVLAPVLRYVSQPLFPNPLSLYMLLPFRMDTLATGALFALVWPERSEIATERLARVMLPVLAVVGFSIFAVYAHLGISTYHPTQLASALLFEASLMLMACVFGAALLNWFSAFFRLKPLLWLGTISYTVYLVHLMARDVVSRVVGGRLATVGGLALTLVYAALSWRYLERPILQLGRSDARAVVERVERPPDAAALGI